MSNLHRVKALVVENFRGAMQAKGITKSELARRLGTSRPQIDRVLDPNNLTCSLKTLDDVSCALGLQLTVVFN